MESITEKSSRQIVTFGVLMALNYPLYQIIWYFASTSGYHNFILRLSATSVCLLLVSSPYWPEYAIKKILPSFWYFALCFCLPFFFTYMTLKNNVATLWLMNSMSSLFFMFLLVDVLSASVLIIIGTLAGIVLFQYSSAPLEFMPGVININGLMATFGPAFVIAGIFSRNNEIIRQEKFSAMQIMSASVAHELRTPLAATKFATVGLSKYLPTLITGYKIAQSQTNEPIKEIRPQYLQLLEELPERISKLLYQANMSIDMMLMNANQLKIDDSSFHPVSIMHCLNEAIKRYPFKSKQQRRLISINRTVQDFEFRGNEILMLHVLYNLMSNALYFIEGQRRGEITISISSCENFHFLYFKDTAKGISPKLMRHLFKQFHSKREGGTGVGLSFCRMVMEAFGGEITCQSTEGVHTTFILSFPKYHNESSEL